MNLRDISQRLFPRPRVSPLAFFERDIAGLGVIPLSFDNVEGKSVVPFHRIRTGLTQMLQSPAHDISQPRVPVYDETQCVETVLLSDIEGCLNSKEKDSRFASMAQAGDMPHYIQLWQDRSDELARQLLSKDLRGVTSAGEAAKIMRQSWDGQMWLANIDASHRTTTLWAVDQASGYKRSIPDSEITILSPSRALLDYNSTHHVWLFGSKEDYNFMRYPAAREAGIHLHKLWGEEGQPHRYALSVPRHLDCAHLFEAMMARTCSLSSVIEDRLMPRIIPTPDLSLRRL